MKLAGLIVIAALGLSACATPQISQSRYELTSTPGLWLQHGIETDPLALAQLEAELGSRGETSFAGAYLGQRTASAAGKKLYSRSGSLANAPGQADDKNCSDFTTAAEAQKYFLSVGGPTRDPNNLDGDGDGLACEWGKTLQTSYAAYKRSRKATYNAPRSTRRSSYSRCYVGPRGGTYTITASGRKNYGGC